MSVRFEHPTGRTQEMRAAAMVRWHETQVAMLETATPVGVQQVFEAAPERSVDEIVAQAVGAAIAGLYDSNEVVYREASCLVERDLVTARAVIQVNGVEAFEDEEPEDDFGLGIVYDAVRDALIAEGVLQVYA